MTSGEPNYARAVLARLVAQTPAGRPDGRPLYAYRFSRDDLDLMRRVLAAGGIRCLLSMDGAAVFVAYTAEWFRRDREGGHWDWKRPLAEIGISYGQDDSYAALGYSDLTVAVEQGLRWWRRPAPADGQRLIAIVREAGFPAAALRNSRAVLGWLQGSVRGIERGFPSSDAVAAEAWRMNATNVVQATFEVAVKLCEALAELRARIRAIDPDAADPIAVLDRLDPGWRTALPLELEARDVATIIETVIRSPLARTSALVVSRSLRRTAGGWVAWMELGLSGVVEPGRLPSPVAERLKGMSRARLATRGSLVGAATAVAAFETVHEEEGENGWRLRPLVGKFEVRFPLEEDVRLGLLDVEGRVLEEFVAEAGDGLALPVIAMEPSGVECPEAAEEWTVLGCSSVRTARMWLGLAVSDDQLEALEVAGERRLIGPVGKDRTLVAISGTARFEMQDGLSLTWRTGSDAAAAPRLCLVGAVVRGPRETVFRGLPRVIVETNEVRREAPLADIVWKGRGRGTWTRATGAPPRGRVLLGVTDRSGELVGVTGALIAPANLQLRPDRSRARLVVSGSGPEGMAARAGGALTVSPESDGRSVDLSSVEPGRTVELIFAWPSPATLSLPNPVTRHALLDNAGRLAKRHERLSISCLHGWRLLCSEPSRICFELAGRDGTARPFTRPVEGEAPLVSYLDDIRNLLGSSDALDGAVRISWIGGEDWVCEVRRYEIETDALPEGGSEADGQRAALLGIAEIGAIDLGRPETAPLRISVTALPETAPRRQSPRGGPWLVFGAAVRPSILAGGEDWPNDTEPLAQAMRLSDAALRESALTSLMSAPLEWTDETLTRWSSIPVVASAERIPYAAFDALRLLHKRPQAAVRLLAEASEAEAQLAVLALQRETPLIWAATSIATWIEAFELRLVRLETQLGELGVDQVIATHDVLGSASRLLDAAPGLSTHLRAVVLALFGAGRGSRAAASFDPLATRLAAASPPQCEETLAAGVNTFIQRHIDGLSPPTGLGLATRAAGATALVRRFPEAFGDVIAAPFVAADAACGRVQLDRRTAAACRTAWLYDPDHFETMTAAACRSGASL